VSNSALSENEVRDVLWLYKQRLLDLRNDFRLVYGLVFKNVKDKAGASMEHTHSQLIATRSCHCRWSRSCGAAPSISSTATAAALRHGMQEMASGARW